MITKIICLKLLSSQKLAEALLAEYERELIRVRTGVTNLQAIYSATVEPSIWLKSNTGKIKIGNNSD